MSSTRAAFTSRPPPPQSAFFPFPAEVLHLIFSHIGIDCAVDSDFHVGVQRANEIALRSLPLASFALYPLVRSALFADVWLGTERRMDKFLKALDLSVTVQGQVMKGYLRQFVRGVYLELKERQVGLDGKNVGGQRYRQQAGPHDGRGAQAFKLVEQLELHGSSIGFANAEAVFNGSKLTTLKLGGIVPGHSGPYADGANLLARTPPPGFHSTLTVLTLFQCQLAEEDLPSPDLRLADVLSPRLPPTLTHVTLGGRLCLSPAFFSRIPCVDITDFCLTNYAYVNEPWASAPNGIDPADLHEALDLGWSKALRRIELKGLDDVTLDMRPLWDWDAMESVRRKVEEMAREREEGEGAIDSKTDLRKPKEVKERKGSAMGSSGKKRSGGQGETSTRKKSKK